MCRAHPRFDRAQVVLDGLAPPPHGIGIVVEVPLHGFEYMLILGSRDVPLLAGRSGGLQHSAPTSIGPTEPQRLAKLFVAEVIGELLACRTAVGVLLGEIDKFLLARASLGLCARRHRRRQRRRDASLGAGDELFAMVIAAVGDLGLVTLWQGFFNTPRAPLS